MISVHILYPRSADTTFDMDYYMSTHMPMLVDALGSACHSWGATSVMGGDHIAIGWAMVESKEAFDAVMAEHGAAVLGDVPNYTNTQPQLVLGNVAEA